jgi:hypothetical protein
MPTAKLPDPVICIFCGARVSPVTESLKSWRRVFNEGQWLYACPLEFPPDTPAVGQQITFGDRLAADTRFILAAAHLSRQPAPPNVAVAAAGGAP